jgi:hypothetical protein
MTAPGPLPKISNEWGASAVGGIAAVTPGDTAPPLPVGDPVTSRNTAISPSRLSRATGEKRLKATIQLCRNRMIGYL